MNPTEFMEVIQQVNPVLFEKLKNYPPEIIQSILKLVKSNEVSALAKLDVSVNFKLEKFEGDLALDSKPFEVITGGDGMPTTVSQLSA